jgi:uncharacterized membrane protein
MAMTFTILTMAKISGLLCVLIGLSTMNARAMSAVTAEMEQRQGFFWFVGFVAAVLGATMLAFYSQWTTHWPVLLTVLGWAAVLKGGAIMLFPRTLWNSVYGRLKVGPTIRISGVIALVLGIVLLYEGYGPGF